MHLNIQLVTPLPPPLPATKTTMLMTLTHHSTHNHYDVNDTMIVSVFYLYFCFHIIYVFFYYITDYYIIILIKYIFIILFVLRFLQFISFYLLLLIHIGENNLMHVQKNLILSNRNNDRYSSRYFGYMLHFSGRKSDKIT